MSRPPLDAPPGTIWVSGPIDWLSVRLLLKSQNLEPQLVTQLLGVEPSNSHVPNTPIIRRDGSEGPIRAEGFWSLSVVNQENTEVSFEDAAALLLARLPDDPVVWRKLPAQPHLIFSLGMSRPNCGFNISPDLARLAVDRNILLGFDIYGEDLGGEK